MAGLTVPAAIKVAAGNSWGGFKAAWLTAAPPARASPVATVIDNPQAARTATALAEDREREQRLKNPEEQARIAEAMARARERITRVA